MLAKPIVEALIPIARLPNVKEVEAVVVERVDASLVPKIYPALSHCSEAGQGARAALPWFPPLYTVDVPVKPVVLEEHPYTPKTFITSSPKWLITFTAIRPPAGRSNGREVSE